MLPKLSFSEVALLAIEMANCKSIAAQGCVEMAEGLWVNYGLVGNKDAMEWLTQAARLRRALAIKVLHSGSNYQAIVKVIRLSAKLGRGKLWGLGKR